MLRALFKDAVFKPNQSSIHAPVIFHSRTLHSQVSALIDSSATESFISPDLVEHFSIPTHEIPKPKVVRNIDGTKNSIGNVTHAATLRIHYEGQDTEHLFYVIDLGDDHMLLGMPFLKATNPHINWTHSAFKGKVYTITSDAHKWKPNQDSKVYKPFYKPPTKGYRHHECTNSPVQYMHVEPDNYIALRCTHIENVLLRRLTKATELAAKEADQTQHPWQELVPLEYHRFGKVFSNKEAQRFPGKCPWDHACHRPPYGPYGACSRGTSTPSASSYPHRRHTKGGPVTV